MGQLGEKCLEGCEALSYLFLGIDLTSLRHATFRFLRLRFLRLESHSGDLDERPRAARPGYKDRGSVLAHPGPTEPGSRASTTYFLEVPALAREVDHDRVGVRGPPLDIRVKPPSAPTHV